MKKIAVAVSGGVDSLYALWSLKSQGYDVFALHGRFLEKEYSLLALEKQCEKWNIPFYIIDLRKEFEKKVIEYFLDAHIDLLTPNPCVICNKEIKFGLLFDKALELGASHLATGHYVDLQNADNHTLLKAALDKTKDQSYFLALVPKERLEKVVFPLANITKDEIRKILQKEEIEIPIPKESQEICFVPNDLHTQYIIDIAKKFNKALPKEGKVKLANPLLSEEEKKNFDKQKHKHKGLWHYTEGQRKGLGIAYKEPLYVIKRQKDENILYVGTKNELTQKECYAHNTNFFVTPTHWENLIKNEAPLFVRTRFRQKLMPAKINYNKEKDLFHVTFLEDESLTAAGQTLAIYNANSELIAGGILL